MLSCITQDTETIYRGKGCCSIIPPQVSTRLTRAVYLQSLPLDRHHKPALQLVVHLTKQSHRRTAGKRFQSKSYSSFFWLIYFLFGPINPGKILLDTYFMECEKWLLIILRILREHDVYLLYYSICGVRSSSYSIMISVYHVLRNVSWRT